ENSSRAGDIVQSDEIGEAMLALRSFMFERVYHAQDHGPARVAVRRIFDELVNERGMDAQEATDYLAGMTDRFALSYAPELDWRVARIKAESVERVKAAMEILPLVEDVVRLRKAGSTYKGLCPFHSEKTPSFTVSPSRGTFKCFGCGAGGDAITFVEKTENL